LNNYYLPNIFEPNINTRRNSTTKIKNKTLAIEAAIAIIKKIAAHLSIIIILLNVKNKNSCHF